MKKQQLVVMGALALAVVFIIGGVMYKGHKAEKTAAMAKAEDSPLNRSYAMSLGPADAKVVIVEFFDPGCETCRAFAPKVKEFLDAYPGKVRLVKRYAPFHHGADKVSQILEAARLQGKYWETLDVMFARQQVWASHHHPKPDEIWQFLPAVGLDIDRLRKDMIDPKIVEIIRQDMADAETLGVHKTPSFFVNGKPLQSFGYRQLKALVGSEVAAQYGS
jgi:protein-disulfide isomerase